jgi:phytoene synthase
MTELQRATAKKPCDTIEIDSVEINAVEKVDAPLQAARQSRDILALHSRSFHWASKFLSPRSRDDAAILYAFCRHVDDAVDEADTRELAAERVEQLRAELRGRRPCGPVLQAFLDLAARRGIDVACAEELVRGVASDLHEVRMPDDRALLRYCYRVAGTVGLMMSPILGVQAAEAAPYAIDLGVGMQLTNICRDVLEDAQNGRVYLPQSRLEAHGVTAGELLDDRLMRSERVAAAVSRVVGDLLDLADQYYASADRGMHFIAARSRLAMCVASRIYRGIGVRLRRRHDANPLHGRTVVPGYQKVLWVGPALYQCAAAGLTRPAAHRAQLHRALDGLPGANAER